jgi:hypothetical protein
MKTAPKNDDPTRFLPVGVLKSYFLLSKADRDVLNIALGKYQPPKSEPILVGGARLLKPALRLLTLYRLRIDEIRDGKAVTSYTRWLEAVQVKDDGDLIPASPKHCVNTEPKRSRRSSKHVLNVFCRIACFAALLEGPKVVDEISYPFRQSSGNHRLFSLGRRYVNILNRLP